MTDRVLWNWFALPIDRAEDAGVVVEESFRCFDNSYEVLDCKIISEPMAMNAAEGKAALLNHDAIGRGKHISELGRQM